jgi:calpain-15
LKQLSHLYFQQKNILIENKTDFARIEIINQNKIDINKLITEEQEKRRKEKEETQKKIEEEIIKGQGEGKKEATLSVPSNTKIFRNQKIYEKEEPWTDPLFKPEKATLCPFNQKGWLLPEDAYYSDVNGWDNFKWCRIEEIIDSKNYSLFGDGIEIEDIIQGKISNCYFLSVLGSLCKFPELIENLFYTKEQTKQHIYGIYFYINGQKKLVLIDDYLPYVGDAFKQFAMSKPYNNKMWVALIEKAWAKINGNYIQIGTGGTANEVFDVLTEAFSEEVKVKYAEKEELWQKLIDGEKNGFLMTAGTYIDDKVLDVGLIEGHSYSVLGVYEIKGEKVLRLRNTWGEGEFYGDWSDYSPKWTDDLREKYNYFEKEDGDFLLDIKIL